MRTRKGTGLRAPLDSKEDQLVDLVIYAISRATRDREPLGRLGNTKIAKIVYDVAERLDLPITRSWYMFGTYVWPDNATEERLRAFSASEPADFVKVTQESARSDLKEEFQAIESEVEKQPLMFEMALSPFLDRLYEKAPRPYKGVYQSHKKVLERVWRIVEPRSEDFPSPQFRNGSKEITAFQKEMLAFHDRPNMVRLVVDYTTLMEDLMVKYDESLDDASTLNRITGYFKQVYNDYTESIWTFPPSVVAIRTLKGPRAEEKKVERVEHLANVDDYLGKAEDLREEAFMQGLYPNETEVLHSQGKLIPDLGTDEKTVRDYFLSTLEPATKDE